MSRVDSIGADRCRCCMKGLQQEVDRRGHAQGSAQDGGARPPRCRCNCRRRRGAEQERHADVGRVPRIRARRIGRTSSTRRRSPRPSRTSARRARTRRGWPRTSTRRTRSSASCSLRRSTATERSASCSATPCSTPTGAHARDARFARRRLQGESEEVHQPEHFRRAVPVIVARVDPRCGQPGSFQCCPSQLFDMSIRLADAIFWVAVACCSVAQLAILRSVVISPARIADSALPHRRCAHRRDRLGGASRDRARRRCSSSPGVRCTRRAPSRHEAHSTAFDRGARRRVSAPGVRRHRPHLGLRAWAAATTGPSATATGFRRSTGPI